jgi:hypothetical protein
MDPPTNPSNLITYNHLDTAFVADTTQLNKPRRNHLYNRRDWEGNNRNTNQALNFNRLYEPSMGIRSTDTVRQKWQRMAVESDLLS